MSFRTRLTLFFVLIVIVPMVAVGIVVFRLISDNETAKVQARLAEGEAAAIGLYDESGRNAATALRRVGADSAFVRAVRSGNATQASARARDILRGAGIARLVFSAGGPSVVDVGRRDAIAPATRDVIGSSGKRLGRLQVSVITAPAFARLVLRVEGRPAVVLRSGRVIGSSVSGRARDLPARGEAKIGTHDYRVATFAAPDFDANGVRVAVLSDLAASRSRQTDARTVAIGILAGFLALAFGFAVAVSRSLQSQIARFLAAARRLGAGDFSTEVPTDGRDEFAELGGEFNKMSRQLEARLEQLERERERLEEAVRRIGESMASNLDRGALLELVVQASVTDELTGLSNHRRFREVLAQESGRAERFGQDLGLVMLDIDHFKSFNDTYGHQQGDVVLREVARVLRESSREIDEPARYGGEEMAVALPQTDLEGAYRFAERVRTELTALRVPRLDGDGPPLRVTASFGAAVMPGSAEDKEALVAAADAALYTAKRQGRNRTVRAEKQAPEPLPAE